MSDDERDGEVTPTPVADETRPHTWICTRCHSTAADAGNCTACGSPEMIPTTTPRGARLLAEVSEQLSPSDATTIDLPVVDLPAFASGPLHSSDDNRPTEVWQPEVSNEHRLQPIARASGAAAQGATADPSSAAPSAPPINVHVKSDIGEWLFALALLAGIIYFVGRYHFCFGGSSNDDFLVTKDVTPRRTTSWLSAHPRVEVRGRGCSRRS